MWQYVFLGEWEIGAFDPRLRSRGMSVHYTVRTCEREDLLVDREIDEDDISDYIDDLVLGPRGVRPQNHTALVRVCKKVPINNGTRSANMSALNATEGRRCYLKKVRIAPPEGQDANVTSGEGIPEDVLEELRIDEEARAAQSATDRGGEGGVRSRRQARDTGTGVTAHSGEEGREEGMEIREQAAENRINATATAEKNGTKAELEEGNEISPNSTPAKNKVASTVEPLVSEGMVHNYIPSVSEKLEPYQQRSNNFTANELSLDYDDYNLEVVFLTHVCL